MHLSQEEEHPRPEYLAGDKIYNKYIFIITLYYI